MLTVISAWIVSAWAKPLPEQLFTFASTCLEGLLSQPYDTDLVAPSKPRGESLFISGHKDGLANTEYNVLIYPSKDQGGQIKLLILSKVESNVRVKTYTISPEALSHNDGLVTLKEIEGDCVVGPRAFATFSTRCGRSPLTLKIRAIKMMGSDKVRFVIEPHSDHAKGSKMQNVKVSTDFDREQLKPLVADIKEHVDHIGHHTNAPIDELASTLKQCKEAIPSGEPEFDTLHSAIVTSQRQWDPNHKRVVPSSVQRPSVNPPSATPSTAR